MADLEHGKYLQEEEFTAAKGSRQETPADEESLEEIVMRDDVEVGEDNLGDGGTADDHPVPEPSPDVAHRPRGVGQPAGDLSVRSLLTLLTKRPGHWRWWR